MKKNKLQIPHCRGFNCILNTDVQLQFEKNTEKIEEGYDVQAVDPSQLCLTNPS